jgi:hypothetical protein
MKSEVRKMRPGLNIRAGEKDVKDLMFFASCPIRTGI